MGLLSCPSTIKNGYIYHGQEIKGAKPEGDCLDRTGAETDMSGSKVLITSDLYDHLNITKEKNCFSSG